mmetsp:Transcript_36627/g.79977  ORF Transcript_36627/g.79977 Transcript_36627/m.79977 type:complete len:203 (-) Transcript_36627:574-1182(-)
MLLPDLLHSGSEVHLRLRSSKFHRRGSVEGFVDVPFQEHCATLVEPEVLPGCIGHQVTGPAVRNLVGHDVHQRTVTSQQSRCQKSQTRVLHATVREGRWQQQHVISSPDVGSDQPFRRLNKILRVGKLIGSRFHHAWLGPNLGSGTHLSRLQFARSDSNQVRRNWHLLIKFESLCVPLGCCRLAVISRHGGHQGGEWLGHGD